MRREARRSRRPAGTGFSPGGTPLRGADPTERLIHFLSDVLYLYDTERFLPAGVSALGVYGEPFDPTRHEAQREVKAVTHHGAAVESDERGYRATIVFDV